MLQRNHRVDATTPSQANTLLLQPKHLPRRRIQHTQKRTHTLRPTTRTPSHRRRLQPPRLAHTHRRTRRRTRTRQKMPQLLQIPTTTHRTKMPRKRHQRIHHNTRLKPMETTRPNQSSRTLGSTTSRRHNIRRPKLAKRRTARTQNTTTAPQQLLQPTILRMRILTPTTNPKKSNITPPQKKQKQHKTKLPQH